MSDEFINFLQSAGISLSNGKIECKTSIPVERINIDIGLSYSAPQSNIWLNREQKFITGSDLLI